MKTIIIFIFISCCIDLQSQEKKTIIVKSDVKEVTVFITGAQVLRKKTIDLAQGQSVIKFVDLSPYLDSKSVQVKVNEDVIVLSVNHQFNYTDSAVKSKELNDLEMNLKAVNEKLKIENVNIEIINEELNFLKDNRNIGGKNQEVSLINLKETANYYAEKISALKMKELDITKSIQQLDIEKAAIEKQVNQISSSNQIPISEVLIKVDLKVQTKCDLELSYFVNNAGWFPSYDIRVKSISDPIDIIYKANIHQNTKEEWRNVKLKLSSTNPNLGNVAPQLQTYFLNYNTLAPIYKNINNQVSGRVYDAKTNEPLAGANVTIEGTTIGVVTDANGNYSLSIPNSTSQLQISYIGYETQTLPIHNSVLNIGLMESNQKLDEVVVTGYGTERKSTLTGSVKALNYSKAKSLGSLYVPTEKAENQTSFEFEIKTPYTIGTDNKNTTVDIDGYSLNADYEYYCVPKIDKDAFLIAHVVDWEKYNLLEGEANIFFENTFVGKSILDVRYVSDTLSISLGRDKNVSVKRDKIKNFITRQFIGSKKEETIDWQISVRNNKQQPIHMTLLDQVPVSTLQEIEVSTDNISGAVLNKDNGEVKWNFTLEPSAKKDLELKYRVKYPKDRILSIE